VLKRARRKPLHYRPLEDYLAGPSTDVTMYRVLLNAVPRRTSPGSRPRFTTASSTAIQALATNPRPSGCRKLAGSKNDWRIPRRDYRVVYEICRMRFASCASTACATAARFYR